LMVERFVRLSVQRLRQLEFEFERQLSPMLKDTLSQTLPLGKK
jgi:hypothetical protein